MTAAVSRFPNMGDGLLVYFGYPQAHEDDAERAVQAGLELIAAVAGLKTRASLQSRLVVVGDLIGAGDAQERVSEDKRTGISIFTQQTERFTRCTYYVTQHCRAINALNTKLEHAARKVEEYQNDELARLRREHAIARAKAQERDANAPLQ